MNPEYHYENQHLWYNDAWQGRDGMVDPLFQWIGSHDSVQTPPPYPHPEGDPRQLTCYSEKTNAVDLPEMVLFWKERGLRYTSLEQGRKHWISMVPEQPVQDGGQGFAALVVLVQDDCDQNPWWAMDTLEKYRQYNEIAARRQDTILLYLIAKGSDEDRIFGNILQEACALYPVDLDRLYLDFSLLERMGSKLSAVPGFSWYGRDGKAVDPDEAVERFDGIPVLNFSGRWGSQDSLTRGLVMNQAMNRGMFDTERLIHSESGKKMAEAIALEHRFQTVYDAGYAEHWDRMGLHFDVNETRGRRWTVLAPKQQLETKELLPLVLAMQEVYRGNEHLAVTAHSYFYEYAELAAQGECIVLFFALEDPDSNDLLEIIAREAMDRYPVDRRRVYVTGHSHDGWFARYFAYRHPDMIAALATMGNHVGLADPAVVGNPIMGVSDAQIDHMRQIDMPTININGANERFSLYPDAQERRLRWAQEWQRRLRASRCLVRELDEILQARESENRAMRTIGIPGDQGVDFWLDGVEHYIVDVRNEEGKFHLRIASSENMPHTVTPCMIDLSWSFLRQFARDLETGAVIDLQEKEGMAE